MAAHNKTSVDGVHFGPIQDLIVSPDDKYIISLGSSDGMLNVVDIENFQIATDFNTSSLTNDQIFTIAKLQNRNSIILTDDGKQVLSVKWPEIADTNKICETDMPMTVLAVDPTCKMVALSGEDPQVLIIDLDSPDENQIQIFDNIKQVVYAGFGPICKTFVTINEDGEIFSYSSSTSYQEPTNHKEKIKTSASTVCWSSDSQLLIADSEKKGLFHVFYFSSDAFVTGKVENLGIITAMSISPSFLLATCDASQKIIISRYPKNFVQTKELPMLYVFDPKTDPINKLLWFNENLIAGDSSGSIHKWGPFENESAKEIEVVKNVIESEDEIANMDSDEDEMPVKEKHIVLKGKHPQKPPKSKQKHPPRQSSDEEEINYDEEEDYDEDDSRRTKNPYILDEASETSGDYESEDERRTSNKTSKLPESRQKLTADDIAQRIKEKFNIQEYSTTPSVTESETDEDRPLTKEEIKELRDNARREKRLDDQFIAHSGSEPELDEEEEDEVEHIIYSGSDISDLEEPDDMIQFMPGSTNDPESKKNFLCFNLLAQIFLRENPDDSTSIDVEYFDKNKYRSLHFQNKEKFLFGTVTTSGLTFASHTRVNYRSHDKWATDSECVIKMDQGETIDLIAAGDEWFALTTNLRRLRIFLSSGLEIAIMNIPYRPMTMAGGEDLLCIVYSGENKDDLLFTLYNIKKRSVIANGLLPFQRTLKWIGIQNHTLYVYGNNHTLYASVFDFGFQFVPMCSVHSKNEENMEFWGVGVNNGKFWGVFLPENQPYPDTDKMPVLKGIYIEPQCADESSKDFLLYRSIYCNSLKEDKDKNGMKMDTELLKLFAEAEGAHRYEKMYQIGLQIVSKKGQSIALQYANSKDEESQEVGRKLEEYYLAINPPKVEEEEEVNEVKEEHTEEEEHKENNKTEDDEVHNKGEEEDHKEIQRDEEEIDKEHPTEQTKEEEEKQEEDSNADDSIEDSIEDD